MIFAYKEGMKEEVKEGMKEEIMEQGLKKEIKRGTGGRNEPTDFSNYH